MRTTDDPPNCTSPNGRVALENVQKPAGSDAALKERDRGKQDSVLQRHNAARLMQFYCAEYGDIIEDAQLLPLLVEIVADHVEDEDLVVAFCCRFLRRTIVLRDNQSDITTVGLFQAICERLQMETSEPEVQHGVEAVLAIVYEHASIQNELVDLGIVAQVVEFVHGCAGGENEGATALVLWHVFKLLELCIRQNDAAKDAVCAGEGPLAMITATQRIRGSASAKKHGESSQCHALYYVACMLFCRVAVTGDPTFAGTAVHPARIAHLVQAGAHEFALVVVQSAGDMVHVAGQAIRLLELIATIGACQLSM
ncbi:hypothetical protein FI667_g5581, partial [Globisporangium splendens]